MARNFDFLPPPPWKGPPVPKRFLQSKNRIIPSDTLIFEQNELSFGNIKPSETGYVIR